MKRDERPDAVAPYTTWFGVRRGGLILFLLIEVLIPRSAWPQESLLKDFVGNFSGVITLTQPLSHATPGDLVQRVMFDASPRALAPWAAAGLRWHWTASLSDWDAHAMGALGLRWWHRPLRVTLSVNQDAVYAGFLREGQSGTVADSSSTQTGYAMQAVTDLSGALSWHAGRMTVGGETGWRLAGPGRGQAWYQADLATALTRNLAMVVGVDGRHRWANRSSPTRLTLGLQWRWVPPDRQPRAAPTPSRSVSPPRERHARFVVHRRQDGVRLRLVATPARQVEVRGDLTDWMAVSMEPSGDRAWQLTLPASPGVHRLAMRVDGGDWLPPPGLPTGVDGYGGKVGLFTVKP